MGTDMPMGEFTGQQEMQSVQRPERVEFSREHAAGGVSLYLASRSPRRRELLTKAGFEFDLIDARLDDGDLDPGASVPECWVAALAFMKAAAGAQCLRASQRLGDGERAIVLGADTVCFHNGDILGQPDSAFEARMMIESFLETDHEVLTGVALVDPNHQTERRVLVESAVVRFGSLSEAQIDAYVESGAWRGKAGAYNLFDRVADGWPIEHRGDPTAIVGLPMARVVRELEAVGVRPCR